MIAAGIVLGYLVIGMLAWRGFARYKINESAAEELELIQRRYAGSFYDNEDQRAKYVATEVKRRIENNGTLAQARVVEDASFFYGPMFGLFWPFTLVGMALFAIFCLITDPQSKVERDFLISVKEREELAALRTLARENNLTFPEVPE